VRLNRFLSQCGLGSRRGSEQIILEGRVSINGHLIKDLGTLVKEGDQVSVDGKVVRAETGIVIALNKPRGYICSRSDERDRMTIYALLPKPLQTLHHVGRLDKDSEGLLLLTNRGDLSHHLIHPSKGAEKEYEVIVDKPVDQTTMAKLVKGMLTEEGYAKAERAWMITEYRCHVVLKQGLKRQIRLMFYQLGCEVERLTRTRIGWLELKGLQKGGWKQLTPTEVDRFFSPEGTTGRPPRPDKPRAPKPESEDEEVIRPARKTAAKERPARGKRPFGKAGAREEKPVRTARPTGRGPARERPVERAPEIEDGVRPVWGKRNFVRGKSTGRPIPREIEAEEVVRPVREKRGFGKGKPKAEGRTARSSDKPRAPREDGPRRPSSRSAPKGMGKGNSRPSSSSKRNGPQRRR
jgi:23S rRNA pseudouridine2605 synthase